MDYDDYDPDNPFDETNNKTFAPPLPFAPPPPRNPQYPPLPLESDSFLPPPPPPSSLIPPPPTSDENYIPQPPPPEDSYLQPAPPSDESNASHLLNYPSYNAFPIPPVNTTTTIDKSEQMKYLTIQQEKEEHERLIHAENLKRKTIIKPVTASFMKFKRIKGFEVESDDDEDQDAETTNNSKRVKKEDTTGKTAVNTKSKTTDNNTATATASKNKDTSSLSSLTSTIAEVSEVVSPELLTMLTKTAAWVVDNPDKAHILIEKSRHNAQMFFLFDRHSPAGIKYLEELSRYKAEKEVHDIFHGGPSVMEQQQQQQQLLLQQQQQLLSLQQQAGMYQSKPVVPPPPLPPSFSSSIVSNDEINRARVTAASLAMNAVALKMQQQLPPLPPLIPSQTQGQTLIVNTTSATANAIHTESQSTSDKNTATTGAMETTVTDTGNSEGWKPKRKSRWDSSSSSSGVDNIKNDTSSYAIAHSAAPPQLTVPAYHDIKVPIPTHHQQQYDDDEIANEKDSKYATATAAAVQDDEQKRQREKAKWDAQIREQKELQLLESRIRSATAAAGKGNSSSREEALYQERLKEYQELAARYEEDMHFKDTLADAEANDGVIEGGTWEHRKRAKEMLETAQRNLEATAIAAGRTHMGDYLPAHILDQFLKKSEALKTGGSAGLKQLLDTEKYSSGSSRDYQEHKLQSDNVGYQMLAKAGWSEGQSLGSSSVTSITITGGSGGIKVEGSNNSKSIGSSSASNSSNTTTRLLEPLVASGQQGSESFGVGVSATHEVTAGDDEFDQYRKRMMLAYRFRPNPMNNPRRDYY